MHKLHNHYYQRMANKICQFVLDTVAILYSTAAEPCVGVLVHVVWNSSKLYYALVNGSLSASISHVMVVLIYFVIVALVSVAHVVLVVLVSAAVVAFVAIMSVTNAAPAPACVATNAHADVATCADDISERTTMVAKIRTILLKIF